MRTLTLVTLFTLIGFINLRADDFSQWLKQEKETSFRNLHRNISPEGAAKGCVVASPSKSSPDYFYHWVRDAGITMDVVVTQYKLGLDQNNFLESRLFDFIDFSLKNQNTPNLSGGPGEPKFNADGSAFSGPWGRPQDDSPALRALALIHLADFWLATGKKDLVVQRLYNADFRSVIKLDLEYISHHWRNTSFDLWEEVKGHHFYTRSVQRRALEEGARLATTLGDRYAADWYRSQAANIQNELYRHWDANKKVVVPTIDWDGGVPYKHSGLDAAVVLGVLHGGSDSGDFSISDDRIVSTVAKIEEAFQNLYPINQKGFPAVAIGRYPEDKYDGYSTSGEGNPWILITSGFAEYYYRLAKILKSQDSVSINSVNEDFYSKLIGNPVRSGAQIDSGKVANQLIQKADSFLKRVRTHSDGRGGMAEQLNRHSGYQQGARDLTWSYGAFLTAALSRPANPF